MQENEVRQAASVLFTRNGLQNQIQVRPTIESATSSLESTPRNSPRDIASRHATSGSDVTSKNQQSNRDSTVTSMLQQPVTKEYEILSKFSNRNNNIAHANHSNNRARHSSDVAKRGDIAFNDDDIGSVDLPITPDVSDEVNMKLEEAERIISQLQEENLRQRREVWEQS